MNTYVYAGKFHHIYVEKRIADHPRTQKILRHFPKSEVIYIDYYKDVFNRRGQDVLLQHANQNLILAAAKEKNVYPGAPVCQDFGNAHFYYASCAMNCLYDCEYCYLKGMYPSGNLVIFVDLERILQEVQELLQRFPVYLCVSYDTDLLAMEDLVHYVEAWTEFTRTHENLTIEIRTKCGRQDLWKTQQIRSATQENPISENSRQVEPGILPGKEEKDPGEACSRVIFAYTISPDPVIRSWEHGTSSLSERLAAAAAGIRSGYQVRLCFDPMIYIPDWEKVYSDMLDETAAAVPLEKVRDFSVGSFRISDSYLKNMRRQMPDSAVVQYPFVVEHGYYHYPEELTRRMEQLLTGQLKKMVPDARIFRWEKDTQERSS